MKYVYDVEIMDDNKIYASDLSNGMKFKLNYVNLGSKHEIGKQPL